MAERRVLIVGADGADPKRLAHLMSEGKLPHFSRLCKAGMWGPLRTTLPAVSPVAWTTCLTGVPPARHGIRDFVTKAEHSYLPTIGLFDVRTGDDGIPIYESRRTAPTLGERLSAAGRSAYILKVPGTFPPTATHGGMLAGFGAPDLLGTFGVSAWYTTDEESKRVSAPDGAEWIQPLTPVGQGRWRGRIAGPANSEQGFVLRREGGRAALSLDTSGGQSDALLAPGSWSGWTRVAFDVPGRGQVTGICRYKLVSLGRAVELYRTPVQCAPDAPLFPLTEPPGFGPRLASLVGPFATLGMPADLDGVRRGVVDLDTFLEDAYANWNQQVEMTLRLMARREGGSQPWDLLMTHLFAVDNVQHLFWHCQDARHPAYRPQFAGRYGGEIERAYTWLDAQLGRLLELSDSNTTVIVVSDHGGAPIYRLLHLNAWLWSQGYLEPRQDGDNGTAARIDWRRSRAAMYGTGGIWLNVQGREPEGIVQPGAPYEALRHELVRALSSWHDPQSGQPVIKEVLPGERVFGPTALQTGPDLVPVLHPGCGLGRSEGLGRVMTGTPTVAPNLSPWSGGHEGPYLPSDVPGICVISGAQVPTGAPLGDGGLEDVAPTVMRLLDLDVTGEMRGHALL